MLRLAFLATLLAPAAAWCGGSAITLPPRTLPPLVLNRPDLVIAQLKVGTPVGAMPYSAINIWVKVKNIGQAAADRTKLTVFVMSLTDGAQLLPARPPLTLPLWRLVPQSGS